LLRFVIDQVVLDRLLGRPRMELSTPQDIGVHILYVDDPTQGHLARSRVDLSFLTSRAWVASSRPRARNSLSLAVWNSIAVISSAPASTKPETISSVWSSWLIITVRPILAKYPIGRRSLFENRYCCDSEIRDSPDSLI
jgi:hypothetical protein